MNYNRHVSIHASSREDATGGKLSGICQPICFNPRVLAGGRDMPLMMMFLVIRFQSTRPRGRTRREIGKKVSYDPEFQSTRPRGRTRRIFDEIDHDKLVSIHASSREDATVNESYIYLALQFQSTRPRGRTRLNKLKYKSTTQVSIHASSREDATLLHRFVRALR